MACHCRGCQQLTSSAFSLSALVRSEDVEVIQGKPVVGGLHRPQMRQDYCPNCMTCLFTRPGDAPRLLSVRTTLLDDARWATPFVEMYTSEKVGWVTIPARRSFPQFPSLQDFNELVAEYQAQAM
jgi:hypothetical protein